MYFTPPLNAPLKGLLIILPEGDEPLEFCRGKRFVDKYFTWFANFWAIFVHFYHQKRKFRAIKHQNLQNSDMILELRLTANLKAYGYILNPDTSG